MGSGRLRIAERPSEIVIIFLYVGGAIGLLFSTLTVVMSSMDRDKLASEGKEATAVVMDVGSDKYGAVSKVEVMFFTDSGLRTEELTSMGNELPSGLSVGNSVDVIYDPQNPKLVAASSQVKNSGMTVTMVAMFAISVMCLLGATALTVKRIRAAPDSE